MLNIFNDEFYFHKGKIGLHNVVYAFDLDWTIIKPRQGKFPKNKDDWMFLPNRIKKLKYFQEQGITLAIFTNQGYQGYKLKESLERINQVIDELNSLEIDPWVFVATGPNSSYRKPDPKMWNFFTNFVPSVDMSLSLYCGDAAGRPQDYDDVDKRFAELIGLKFFEPEKIFGPK